MPLPFASEGNPFAPQADAASARRLFRRRSGLLRAHLRRALFPDLGVRQAKAGRRRATVFARPAKPRWSTAAISTMPRPRAESPIPNCRMRFAIATRLVAGCTCNGKDQFGLAPVKIENDPTLAQGRHRRRAGRPDGRRPRRRQTRRVAEFLAGPGIGALALSARAGGGVGMSRRIGQASRMPRNRASDSASALDPAAHCALRM